MTRLLNTLIRLRADERGVAMVAVMGVLLVTSTLAFAVAATAQRGSEGTVRDTNSKRALAAAETGLNVGRFKAGKTFGSDGGDDGKCFPDVSPSTTCTWTAFESAGNGAEFSYWVSPVLSTSPGTACVAAVTPPTPADSRERCVTAIGRFNGVQRRLQTRVVENRGAPVFPFPGLLGLDRVALNGADANGTVGTNGQISLTGQGSDITEPARIRLGGGGWAVSPVGYASDRRDVSPDPFVLDFRTAWYSGSVKAPQATSPFSTTPPTYGTNSIGSLSGAPGFSTTASRQASLAPGASVTLTAGREYNFCSLKLNAGAQFVIPADTTEPVRVFIDSSTRPGTPDYVPSGCPAFSGNVLDVANEGGFINNTGKASMLQVYVYGGPNENVVFNASANFTGTLYAPQSSVVFNNGATLTGAMAARDIEFRNNGGNPGFVGDPDASSVTGRWEGSYKRSGWRECSPTGGTPGC